MHSYFWSVLYSGSLPHSVDAHSAVGPPPTVAAVDGDAHVVVDAQPADVDTRAADGRLPRTLTELLRGEGVSFFGAPHFGVGEPAAEVGGIEGKFYA